jgi:hypothetical protein
MLAVLDLQAMNKMLFISNESNTVDGEDLQEFLECFILHQLRLSVQSGNIR